MPKKGGKKKKGPDFETTGWLPEARAPASTRSRAHTRTLTQARRHAHSHARKRAGRHAGTRARAVRARLRTTPTKATPCAFNPPINQRRRPLALTVCRCRVQHCADEACRPFGFAANDVIITPLGIEVTVIGVKPAPKPEAPEAPEGGADGAEPTDEGEEDKKEDEKPRGNGTMWALFPGGYQVLSCVYSHRVRWRDSGPRGSRAHAPGSVALRSLAPLSPTVSLSFPRLLANSRRYARRQRRNLRSRATEEHTRACTLCEIRQYLKPNGEYDASMLPLHRTKLA